MMKFSALNESSLSDDDGDPELATREAQEEESYALYNAALKCQSEGNLEESEEMFKELLEMDFITQSKPSNEKEKSPLRPALTLKYLIYKNLATISSERKDYKSSVEFYLEALNMDSTDVNMWYRMGKASLNIPNYALSSLCFEEGLKCNPNHWPCLDSVITVMYTLNDYSNCLYYISKALEKECYYLKGLALKDEIYNEDPSLKSFCEGYFKRCNSSINSTDYDEEEAKQYVEECLEMRKKKHALYKPSPLPVLALKHSIKEFTWKCLGESFIHMYEFISSTDPQVSYSCRIDLSQYMEGNSSSKATTESDKPSSPLSSLSDPCSSNSASPTSHSSQQQNGGLLQIAPSLLNSEVQNLEVQTAGVQVASNQIEMEIDDTPNVCNINSSYTIMLPQTDMHTGDISMYNDSTSGNKRAKRKRLLSELSDFVSKRRSTRVRNTTTVKKPQDNINYQELLQKFLPPRLIGDGKFDEQDDDSDPISQDKVSGDHSYVQSVENDKKDGKHKLGPSSLCSTEKEDVQEFISACQSNYGIIDLLYRYVTYLGSKSNLVWPKYLLDVYCNCFVRMRNHVNTPNLFCQEIEKLRIKEIGMAVLVYSEFKVDHWYLTTGHSMSFSPKIPTSSPGFQNNQYSVGKDFHADMEFLVQLTGRSDVLEDDWLEYTLRALWLKAKFHSLEGEIDLAVCCMEKLSNVFSCEDVPPVKIKVENCTFSNIVTSDNVQRQLESLQRCQSLEEVQRLYEHGDYSAVVDLLILTFTQPRAKRKQNLDGVPERHAQLILLQNSLWNLKRYKDCVYWSEASFNEALQQFMNAARCDWSETMAHLLSGLDKCAKLNRKYLSELEESKLVRLTQNLILVIVIQMENYDFTSDSSLLVVLPWIILYRLILNEELKAQHSKAKKSKQNTIDKPNVEENSPGESCDKAGVSSFLTDFDLSSAMPSSLMLLFTAHEYLGRRSWCASSEGFLLLHCIEVMMNELEEKDGNVHLYREDLETGLEQCFYCLYGHPNKRTRAKHLQEHNSSQISLTWERADQIFKYFKPDILPEFDSYRTSTVSAELENLLKRITSIVPPEEDPASRVDSYTAYIEGGSDKCPEPIDSSKAPSAVVKDLYYLLGDYYFKNKEFSKAIRFYLLDICINPNRLDSWAGMALSRSSQLDQKLNSYEHRNETTIYRKSASTLKCFEHALEVDPTTISLWIEYGSLAYILHSHASRQLKQDSFVDGLSDLLKKKKLEMLEVAERCFRSANHCDEGGEPEEAWLHHYMLGKIAEKKGDLPKVFLDHYKKALMYLHEDEARYPQKIQYHNPLELAIEALEVYYRVHASCLKFLWRHEAKGIDLETLKNIQSCISEVASSPFALFQEKCKREREISSSISASEEEYEVQPPECVDSENKLDSDHNYFDSVQNIAKKLMDNIPIERGHRPSTDSSSELEEAVVVKEVINLLISVISERFIDEDKEKYNGEIVVLEDKTTKKLEYSDGGENEKPKKQIFYKGEPVQSEATVEIECPTDIEKMDIDVNPAKQHEKDDLATLEDLASQLETQITSAPIKYTKESDIYLNNVEQISSSGDDNLIIDEAKTEEVNKPVAAFRDRTSTVTEHEISRSLKQSPDLDEIAATLNSVLASIQPKVTTEEIDFEETSTNIAEMKQNTPNKNERQSTDKIRTEISNGNGQIKCSEAESTEDVEMKDNVEMMTDKLLVSVPLSKLDKWPKSDVENGNLENTNLNDHQKHSEGTVNGKSFHQESFEDLINEKASQKNSKISNGNGQTKGLVTESTEDVEMKEDVIEVINLETSPDNNAQSEDLTEENSVVEEEIGSNLTNQLETLSDVANKESVPSDTPKSSENAVEENGSEATENCTSSTAKEKIISSETETVSTKGQSSEKTNEDLKPITKNSIVLEAQQLPKPSVTHQPTPEELRKSRSEISKLIPLCLDAMRECLQRFIQHYKALYRMAHYYCHSNKNKNLQFAREILLAATPPVKKYPSMPGLFADRKNTNFFNGIWRAPSNEIDRPGSFGAHMCRSVHLLIEVLTQQKDYNMLLNLTQQLHRTPDLGRKYMRDTERVNLVREAYDCCVNILRDQMNSLLQEEPPPEENRLICCLLEIYRSCQTLLKAGIHAEETNDMLEEAYTMYRIGEVDSHPSVLEQAIQFCQIQLGKSYQNIYEGTKYGASSKYLLPTTELNESGANALPSVSSFAPDAWQKEFTKSLMMPTLSCEARIKQDMQNLPDPLILIPLEAKCSSHLGQKQSSVQCGTAQMVHVEKPKAENLQACSVAFLPMAPVYSTENPNVNQLPGSSTLLSCQAFECFDVLTTIMQASGYKVAPQATAHLGEMAVHQQSVSGMNREGQGSCSNLNIMHNKNWKAVSDKRRKRKARGKCPPFAKVECLDLCKRTMTKPIVNCTIANEIIDLKVDVNASSTKSSEPSAKYKKTVSVVENDKPETENYNSSEVLNLTVNFPSVNFGQTAKSSEGIKRKAEAEHFQSDDINETSVSFKHTKSSKRKKIFKQVPESSNGIIESASPPILKITADAEFNLKVGNEGVDLSKKTLLQSELAKDNEPEESVEYLRLDLIERALKQADLSMHNLESITEESDKTKDATTWEKFDTQYGNLELSKDSATEFAICSPKQNETSEVKENSTRAVETIEMDFENSDGEIDDVENLTLKMVNYAISSLEKVDKIDFSEMQNTNKDSDFVLKMGNKDDNPKEIFSDQNSMCKTDADKFVLKADDNDKSNPSQTLEVKNNTPKTENHKNIGIEKCETENVVNISTTIKAINQSTVIKYFDEETNVNIPTENISKNTEEKDAVDNFYKIENRIVDSNEEHKNNFPETIENNMTSILAVVEQKCDENSFAKTSKNYGSIIGNIEENSKQKNCIQTMEEKYDANCIVSSMEENIIDEKKIENNFIGICEKKNYEIEKANKNETDHNTARVNEKKTDNIDESNGNKTNDSKQKKTDNGISKADNDIGKTDGKISDNDSVKSGEYKTDNDIGKSDNDIWKSDEKITDVDTHELDEKKAGDIVKISRT